MGQERFYPILVWINPERLELLRRAGLEHFTREVFAGMCTIEVKTTEDQKSVILREFQQAKVTTTDTIELLPREVKDTLFQLVLEKKSLDVVDDFLTQIPQIKAKMR